MDVEEMDWRAASDTICGPRCVKNVLEWYRGPALDLVSIVEEMRTANVAHGTPLSRIGEMLQRRSSIDSVGIHVSGDNYSIQWNYPVIACLKGSNPASGLCHFVVLLPESTSRNVVFWDGLAGRRTESAAVFYRRTTGDFLLTDVKSIPSPSAAVVKTRRVLEPFCVSVCVNCVRIVH